MTLPELEDLETFKTNIQKAIKREIQYLPVAPALLLEMVERIERFEHELKLAQLLEAQDHSDVELESFSGDKADEQS